MKENDIYHARWKDPEKSNHCFEGLVKVTKEIEVKTDIERLIYVDMFWRTGGNKWWTEKEAESQLNLTYYCNLDDFDLTVNIGNHHVDYAEKDIIFLHDQHACVESCKYYFMRKGAVKSPQRMIEAINNKIEKHERDIRYAESSIEWLRKDLDKINQTAAAL